MTGEFSHPLSTTAISELPPPLHPVCERERESVRMRKCLPVDDNSVVVAVWKCSGVSDHIWATAAKIIMIIISLPRAHYISHYNYSGHRDNYNYLIIITQGNEIIITLLQRRKRGCIIIM